MTELLGVSSIFICGWGAQQLCITKRFFLKVASASKLGQIRNTCTYLQAIWRNPRVFVRDSIMFACTCNEFVVQKASPQFSAPCFLRDFIIWYLTELFRVFRWTLWGGFCTVYEEQLIAHKEQGHMVIVCFCCTFVACVLSHKRPLNYNLVVGAMLFRLILVLRLHFLVMTCQK